MTWAGWGDILPTLTLVAVIAGLLSTAVRLLVRPVAENAAAEAEKRAREATRVAVDGLYDRLKGNDFRHVDQGLANLGNRIEAVREDFGGCLDRRIGEVRQDVGNRFDRARQHRKDMEERLMAAIEGRGGPLEELEWRFNNRNNPYIFRDALRRIVHTDPTGVSDAGASRPHLPPSGDPCVIDQHRGVVRGSSEGDAVERLAGVRAVDLRAVDGQRPRNHGAPIQLPLAADCPAGFPRLHRALDSYPAPAVPGRVVTVPKHIKDRHSLAAGVGILDLVAQRAAAAADQVRFLNHAGNHARRTERGRGTRAGTERPGASGRQGDI